MVKKRTWHTHICYLMQFQVAVCAIDLISDQEHYHQALAGSSSANTAALVTASDRVAAGPTNHDFVLLGNCNLFLVRLCMQVSGIREQDNGGRNTEHRDNIRPSSLNPKMVFSLRYYLFIYLQSGSKSQCISCLLEANPL